jgi:large subunit ribosomal protein L10
LKQKKSKAETVEEMRGTLGGLTGAVIAEHKGLTVAEVTALRKKLRGVGAEFRVVKNTLVKLAAKNTPFSGLDGYFSGPTAIAFAGSDAAAVAKAIKEFAATSPKLTIKAGYLDGKALDAKQVQALADLPPREVLLGRLASGLASPLTRLVQALSGPQRKLVYALDSIKNQKPAQENA